MQIVRCGSINLNYNSANRRVSFGSSIPQAKGAAKAKGLLGQAANEILADGPLTPKDINIILNLAARVVESSISRTVGDSKKQEILTAAKNLRKLAGEFISL